MNLGKKVVEKGINKASDVVVKKAGDKIGNILRKKSGDKIGNRKTVPTQKKRDPMIELNQLISRL